MAADIYFSIISLDIKEVSSFESFDNITLKSH